jgi:hypothetical protein
MAADLSNSILVATLQSRGVLPIEGMTTDVVEVFRLLFETVLKMISYRLDLIELSDQPLSLRICC